MNPDERKCGNCWCWRNPKGFEASRPYGSIPADIQLAWCSLPPTRNDGKGTNWCCPEHRSAEEQAAMWEARAVSIKAWVGNDTACAEARARLTAVAAQLAVVKGMADRYEEAMAGVANDERAAVAAWLRGLGIRNLADDIEAGAHRKTGEGVKS